MLQVQQVGILLKKKNPLSINEQFITGFIKEGKVLVTSQVIVMT